jgi:predicted lipoprotein with Yx(FWY)xxD motif
MKSKTILGFLMAALLLVAACSTGGGATTTAATDLTTATTVGAVDTTSAPGTTAAAPATTAAAGGEGVSIVTSDLGDILVAPDGFTLYVFMPDAQGDPTCNDTCADNWPALGGPVTAGEGVDAALLGTATRDDGSVQATYNGWPLYYFAGDPAVGDTNGQGVSDIWWVVDPAGEPISS